MEKLTPGLYLVATPLGNLGDMSARGIDVLCNVDVIACEDTREMKKLLTLLNVERGTRDIISVHEHNERDRADFIIEQIVSGKSVAYASDAGMPAISDPGSVLVDCAHDAQVMVTTVPGATAATSAVALSGFASTEFYFAGFFPRATKEKAQLAERISRSVETVVFYESPKRLGATLRFLEDNIDADQRVVVCRELTKKFEEIIRGTSVQVADHFDGEVKGECVVVIEGNGNGYDPAVHDEQKIRHACEVLKAAGISSRDAVDVLGGLCELPKNRLKEIYGQVG